MENIYKTIIKKYIFQYFGFIFMIFIKIKPKVLNIIFNSFKLRIIDYLCLQWLLCSGRQ